MGLAPGDEWQVKPIVMIRQTVPDDIDALLAVERGVWPDYLRFDASHFEAHMEVFPEGSVCAEVDREVDGKVERRMVGIATVQVVQWVTIAALDPWTWYRATDDGYIRKTHTLKGDTLYGVSLSVLPKYRPTQAAVVFMEYLRRLAVRLNLKQAVVEARIPSYSAAHEKSNKRLTAEMHVQSGGAQADLGMYQTLGMTILTVVPNYVYDPESHNYAAIMHWRNPAHV